MSIHRYCTRFGMPGLTLVLVAGWLFVTSQVMAADADLDPTFNYDGKIAFAMHSSDSVANAVAVQPDGKLIAVGDTMYGADQPAAVARYQGDESQIFVDFFEWGSTIPWSSTIP